MPFFFLEGDITRLKVDAIVNAANNTLLGGGGVDGCIHRAAGPGLVRECAKLNGCDTGDAKITGAYRLPCKHVIHTVGPVWYGGSQGEEKELISCYQRSLQLAGDNDCHSVAFPLISAGIYGYPKEQAIIVAQDTIVDFLQDHDLDVFLVIYNHSEFCLSKEFTEPISSYIKLDSQKLASNCETQSGVATDSIDELTITTTARGLFKAYSEKGVNVDNKVSSPSASSQTSMSEEPEKNGISQLLVSLSQLISDHGISHEECCYKANIASTFFTNPPKDVHNIPIKQVVLAVAVALGLSPSDSAKLLNDIGIATDIRHPFDAIVNYFLEKCETNINVVNRALMFFNQQQLGFC